MATGMATATATATESGGNGNGNKGGGGNCFLKGTKIQTAEGERKIEDLTIGDLLPTVFGGLRPVQWIGRYPYKKSDPSKPWVRERAADSYRTLRSRR